MKDRNDFDEASLSTQYFGKKAQCSFRLCEKDTLKLEWRNPSNFFQMTLDTDGLEDRSSDCQQH